MPSVNIRKLSIEAPGLTVEQGQRLAELVVDGLTGIRWPDQAASASSTNITVVAGPGEMAVEQLAYKIVREILRQSA